MSWILLYCKFCSMRHCYEVILQLFECFLAHGMFVGVVIHVGVTMHVGVAWVIIGSVKKSFMYQHLDKCDYDHDIQFGWGKIRCVLKHP